MLIDWVTGYLSFEHLPQQAAADLRLLTDRVVRFKPQTHADYDEFVHQKTGEQITKDGYFLLGLDTVIYETACWESVRSDSHQIAFRVGSDAIWIQGSPARVCGSGDAVFGEGASAALDLPSCLKRMAVFVSGVVGITLSLNPEHWHVSRIDVTGSLMLEDLASVRIALRTLRECEGGRYRVSQQAGDTVYWSHKSRLRAGKAYAKGPHIDYQLKKKDYSGRQYSDSERSMINRLLRLELRLGAQWIRERAGKKWFELTPNDLKKEWKDYFQRMIGDADMKTNDDVKTRIFAAAKTEGQAKAAHCCFLIIQSEGWEKAKEDFPKNTWYRHLRILRAAGLGDADISAGKVVQLRRKVLECQVVHSWNDLYQKAA
ncbi:MAG: phage/plasmid replication protein, II/X family [Methylococcales bacterium]|nr:phage/plasmid replication protein, II/X family [Methylococcales bacterium]